MGRRPVARVWDMASASDAGIGRRRLLGPEFERVTAGAYLAWADADDRAARVRAVQRVRPDAVASHWTAVALVGLPVPPTRRSEPLHLLVGPGSRPLRRAGLVAHSSATPVHVVTVGGVRATGPVRSWCDLARSGAAVHELVAVGDALVRARPEAAAVLAGCVASGGRRRGIDVARRALTLLDPRAESVMESWVRVVLLLAGLPAPVLQHEVRTPSGSLVARVDLAWPDRMLVLEYDGEHHRDRATWVRDLRRRERLEALGWTVLVVTATDVLTTPDDLVRRVAARLGC